MIEERHRQVSQFYTGEALMDFSFRVFHLLANTPERKKCFLNENMDAGAISVET